jgi:transcription initiation factor TFIID subunit 7
MLVDLPTIMESHKTIDSKTSYKTADICQRLICKEGEDLDDEEVANSPDKKKKDPNKEDKKYLYPHGIGPPLKTLRKKYVEAPEIEKEVGICLLKDLRVHFGSSGEEALES